MSIVYGSEEIPARAEAKIVGDVIWRRVTEQGFFDDAAVLLRPRQLVAIL